MAFGGLDKKPTAAPMADINMTPLIDVMLVLLVIFIITAPLFTHAIRLDLPRVAAAEARETPQTITLSIDAASKLYWNGKPITLDQMRAQFADEPARPRIFVEQMPAHAAVLDHLRQLRGDAGGQRVELRQRCMLGACHQQIQIADQHIALDAAFQFIVGNHDAARFDARSIRTEYDRHAVLPGEHSGHFAERRFEREALRVAHCVRCVHARDPAQPAGAM